MHMGKRRDMLVEAIPQMKYNARSGKVEMGWIMEISERCNMKCRWKISGMIQKLER